ncbi:NUDIX hydrolase [Neobacillus terrae]|uniref:NUDIX hydrolase n=1 Tax=Neobacillus terrae TaxID=3034837 RepID=UPI00140BB984|nr:NUDIX hydrolase [Neobacillus terrae]NHM30959.1 NUDIX hydrolase [Neobacillus terrae]
MKNWYGAAGVCINEEGKLLMVLQGQPHEKKTWSIPSRSKEKNERFKECCIREVEEETGYIVEVADEIKIKHGHYEDMNITFEVHYFAVKAIGGERVFQDPDQLIYDIAWKTQEELRTLDLSFPEDREFLISYMEEKCV